MKTITYIATAILLLNSSYSFSEPHCGNFKQWLGPFDYTNYEHREQHLDVVEFHHFTKNVENLISGHTSFIGGDLDFVLTRFPNHHRALVSMSKLALRDKTNKPDGAKYSVLCYFDRAIRFKPNDATVRYVFSSYLLETNKFDMALEQLDIASKLEPDNPAINYNLGLLYFEKKNYDKAILFAKKAYSKNFPLPGLKNKLSNIGKWKN